MRNCRNSLLLSVSDNVALDSLVHVAVHNPMFHQILLGSIGPEAHDAPGPAPRHPRNLHQFFNACMIYIHSHLLRRGMGRRRSLGPAWRETPHHPRAEDRHQQHRDSRSRSHRLILPFTWAACKPEVMHWMHKFYSHRPSRAVTIVSWPLPPLFPVPCGTSANDFSGGLRTQSSRSWSLC